MRRLAPRPIGTALEEALSETRPPGVLAKVQRVWAEVAGAALADAATPVSERDGVITVACESGVWAQELELLAGDLQIRLDGALGGAHVERLRFVVGSRPNRPA